MTEVVYFFKWFVCAVLILFLIVSPGLLLYFYHYLRVKRWEQKYLPTSKGKDSEAFMNAYICASVIMIKLDRRDAGYKIELLKKRIATLGRHPEGLIRTFDKIWENEIDERRIAKWCYRNLKEAERGDLVYMLIEIGYLDGSFLKREYDFLVRLMQRMKLPIQDLKVMMASHRQRMYREEAERQQKERERAKSRQKRTPASKSARELAFQVLGIPVNSDESVIKKTYRSLVKKHHPDRFSQEDEAIIKAAEARFIEIQKAYEIITE